MNMPSSDSTRLALNIDRLMRRIHAELQPRAAEFDRHQVGPLGGMLLLTVAESEPAEIQSVVELLGRDKSQISRLIRSLESKGLLRRERCALDGRVSVISLTDAGREQLDRITDVLTLIVEDLFANFSNKEKIGFASMLERVLAEDEN